MGNPTIHVYLYMHILDYFLFNNTMQFVDTNTCTVYCCFETKQ